MPGKFSPATIKTMYLKTEGLILRQTDYKDRDRLLTVLSRDYGKMTLKARGVRAKNSKLSSTCQLLTYGEFTLTDYQGYHVITEAEPMQMFFGLRNNLELLSLGSYFAQVVEVVSQEDSPDPALLSLILNALYALSQQSRPQKLVKAAFELRIACLAGYEPNLMGCPVCGDPSPNRFNVSKGCLQCKDCGGEVFDGIRMPVSLGTLAAMRYIVDCPAKRLFAFTLPEAALEELNAVTEAYLCTQFERGFYTLDFYKSLLLQ